MTSRTQDNTEDIATPVILAALAQKITVLFANALLHPPSLVGAHDYFPPSFFK